MLLGSLEYGGVTAVWVLVLNWCANLQLED